MTYNVDGSGEVDAGLAMSLAASVARGFGHEGVAAVEQAGGALAGASISGTDPAAQDASPDAAIPADAGRGAARRRSRASTGSWRAPTCPAPNAPS